MSVPAGRQAQRLAEIRPTRGSPAVEDFQRLVLQVNVIRSVLLKLWPLLEPGCLVSVSQRQSDGNGNLSSTQSFLDWKELGITRPDGSSCVLAIQSQHSRFSTGAYLRR
jgi:hypothetical protein